MSFAVTSDGRAFGWGGSEFERGSPPLGMQYPLLQRNRLGQMVEVFGEVVTRTTTPIALRKLDGEGDRRSLILVGMRVDRCDRCRVQGACIVGRQVALPGSD